MMACGFGTDLVNISNNSFSGYSDQSSSRCNGFDGVIVTEPNFPIVIPWGDCPNLLVAGKSSIGIVHAARDTIDMDIVRVFFERFLVREAVQNVRIAMTPCIAADFFDHEWLDLRRASCKYSIRYLRLVPRIS